MKNVLYYRREYRSGMVRYPTSFLPSMMNSIQLRAFVFCAALVTAVIVLNGCGDDSSVNTALPVVRGRIVDGDSLVALSLSGITVTDSTIIALTDSTGNYTISGVKNGTYVLRPYKAGLRFEPESKTVIVNGENVSGVDFTAFLDRGPVLPVVRGRIIKGDSLLALSLSSITVTDGSILALTDSVGNYTISGVKNGTYVLRPSKLGLQFEPVSRTIVVNGQDVVDVDFAASSEESGSTVAIGGGSYTMGSTKGNADEMPVHSVTVGSFIMAKHEVTQAEWEEVMQSNPSQFVGPQHPVERVSWYDAISYCNALSQRRFLEPAYTVNGTTVTWNPLASGYRLPTEAEWEYACRAGTSTDFYSGDLSQRRSGCFADEAISTIGWYCNNSSATQNVEQKNPNAYGLYDITGNVFEWCWDWRGDYTTTAQTNPRGPNSGSIKICRGGSFFYTPMESRSTFRLAYAPTDKYNGVGFRVVRNGQ